MILLTCKTLRETRLRIKAVRDITLTPPDMENVENRRISVRTYRLLAILSCHRDVLQDSLFILKTAYRQKSDL